MATWNSLTNTWDAATNPWDGAIFAVTIPMTSGIDVAKTGSVKFETVTIPAVSGVNTSFGSVKSYTVTIPITSGINFVSGATAFGVTIPITSGVNTEVVYLAWSPETPLSRLWTEEASL